MDLGGVTKNVSSLRLQDWVTTMVRDNRIKQSSNRTSKASKITLDKAKGEASRVKPLRFEERGTLYDTFSTMACQQPITSPSAIKIKNG